MLSVEIGYGQSEIEKKKFIYIFVVKNIFIVIARDKIYNNTSNTPKMLYISARNKIENLE